MRVERLSIASRQRYALLALCALVSGCGAVATFTQPDGDGGWHSDRREQELARRAATAGVEFESSPAAQAAEDNIQRPAALSGPLDLHTALTLAASGNRRIAEAARQLDVARGNVADTRGRLLPATVGSGRYTWYTDAQTVRLPAGIAAAAGLPPGAAPPSITIRDSEAGTLNGTVTLPLDFSGEIRHALAAAQAGYRGEQARLWATTLDQQVLVVRSYYALLEARRLRDVTAQTVSFYRQQQTNADSRFENGRVTKNQLLVVQVALRNAEEQLLQRDLAIDQARWSLNQVVGLEINAPTEVADVQQRPDLPAVAEALHLACRHNPVIISLLEEQQRLEESLRSLQRSRFPRFSAGGAVDYSSSSMLQPQEIGSGFAGFTWDVGTDMRREAQIAAARSATDKNRVSIERQLRDIEAAVRTTHRAAEERLAAWAAAESAVGQAEENLRIRQQQFDTGRATSEDVLDAEALLAQQRATLATALYQAHTRRAELQELIGLSLDEASTSR